MTDWTDAECTLPTAQRPLRVAEFDGLFAAVRHSVRAEQTRLDLVLPRDVELAARDLAGRESACCAFFSFEFDTHGQDVSMRISVPPSYVDVLDAVEERVTRASPGR